MGRITNFVAVGVVIIVAVYARRFMIDLLGPGSALWKLVADIQYAGIDGDVWAQSMYEAAAVWVPWLIVGGSIVGALYWEFARTNVTQVRR
jgi:hypothetical protein